MEIIEFHHFSSFYIDAAGVLKKNKPWLHPTRNWDILVLAYMDKGSLVLYEDSQELNITDQTFYVLFPNRTHYATSMSSGQLLLPWIHLVYHHAKPRTVNHVPLVYSSEIPSNEDSYGKIYIPSIWKVQNTEYVKSKFLETYRLHSKKDPYSHNRAILTVMEILMHLCTEYLADPEIRRKEIEANPMKRLGTARQIGDAVVFLASEEAMQVNGHLLMVDGGLTVKAAQPDDHMEH